MRQTPDSALRAEAEAILDRAGVLAYQAMVFGLKLAQKQADLAHRGDGDFQAWLKIAIPRLSRATAYRWIDLGKRCLAAVDIPKLDISVTEMLETPMESLPTEAQEAKQLFLDFTENKTIAECLRACAMEGDEPSRLTRAANGKMKGGHNGEDRKDFSAFISRKLKEITSHLLVSTKKKAPKADRSLDEDHKVQISAAFDSAIAVWPRWVLEGIKAGAHRELKLTDIERMQNRGRGR